MATHAIISGLMFFFANDVVALEAFLVSRYTAMVLIVDPVRGKSSHAYGATEQQKSQHDYAEFFHMKFPTLNG